MRVLIDANIFISYLLKSSNDNTITRIVDAGFENKYTLLLPYEVAGELTKKIKEKTYLSSRITQQDAQEFIEVLMTVAEIVPAVTEDIPVVSRDKKDDYLLAYAVIGEVDYLVSGDSDLQILKELEGIRIVSPVEFLDIIRKS